MDLTVPTVSEMLRVLGPALVVLVLWLATRHALRRGRPALRDAVLGVLGAGIVIGLLAGAV